MFGIHLYYEGLVEPGTGKVTVDGSFNGVRWLFVFGKGPNPVKTVAMNVIAGGENDLGLIDIQDVCPEKPAPGAKR